MIKGYAHEEDVYVDWLSIPTAGMDRQDIHPSADSSCSPMGH